MVTDRDLLLDNSLDIQLKLKFLSESLYRVAYNELEHLPAEHDELVDYIRGFVLCLRGVSQECQTLLDELTIGKAS